MCKGGSKRESFQSGMIQVHLNSLQNLISQLKLMFQGQTGKETQPWCRPLRPAHQSGL